jgi:hypothetical protein
LHPIAERSAREYLAIADEVFGEGRVVGFYLVGSIAYDAYRPNQSDVDFFAVLDEHRAGDLGLMRRVQLRSAARIVARAARRGWIHFGVCNGAYIAASELSKPVTEIVPIGSHVSLRHGGGEAFDVNPVQWKTFAERGIALRGPAPAELGLDPEPQRLREWNLDNLNGYWTWAANKAAGGVSPNGWPRTRARWTTAWVVLGPARLHHTIATGGIVTKEQAGDYALDVFDREWHPIIRDAVGFHRGTKPDPAFRDRTHRFETSGAFALHVIAAANQL